jgi:hypothetical protein
MTCLTLDILAVFHEAMKTGALFNVFGYVLMVVASQASVSLLALVKRFMAVITLEFELFMAIDYFARHKYGFENISFSGRTEA